MGVATGCGCKEVYRFPHILCPAFCISVADPGGGLVGLQPLLTI